MDIATIESVNEYIIQMKESPAFTKIIFELNDRNIDYSLWSDTQIILWGLKNLTL
jgi:hypothetical protein